VRRVRVLYPGGVAELRRLERVCVIFLDRLAPIQWSGIRHQDRVVREKRSQRGGITLVLRFIECLIYSIHRLA
jgi:hypothetical protein